MICIIELEALRNELKLEGFPLRFPFYNCWFVGFDGEFSIGDSYIHCAPRTWLYQDC